MAFEQLKASERNVNQILIDDERVVFEAASCAIASVQTCMAAAAGAVRMQTCSWQQHESHEDNYRIGNPRARNIEGNRFDGDIRRDLKSRADGSSTLLFAQIHTQLVPTK